MKKNNYMKVKELIDLLENYPREMPVQFETKDGETIDEMIVDAGNGYVIISEF